ncbi:MCE family protein [Nocardioides speluncae]|uniref:MCE family protein n=1 Tax=Nocardioides speluncae TaxID=2670337 RepID=UPI001379AD0C|nr:MCE family protein [Nocardioides speluncae]
MTAPDATDATTTAGAERGRRVLLGLVLGVTLLLTNGCTPLGGGDTKITAEFRDSAGLFVGNDVGVLGVPVGEITSIEPAGEVVKVELKVDGDISIPASAGAVVVARSVATDRYIELTPVYAEGPRMKSGATIPLDRTRAPVEFDEALATLADITKGLKGEDGEAATLRRLLEAGATNLRGRGADINDTIDNLTIAAEGLADNRGEITGTVDDLDALVTLLATNKTVVDEFITSITDTTDLFADESQNFGRSLKALQKALRTLARFVRDNRKEIRSTTVGVGRLADRLLTHQADLEETLEVLPLTVKNIGDAVNPETNRLNSKLPLQYISPIQPITEPICELLPDICAQLGTSPDLAALLDALTGGLL